MTHPPANPASEVAKGLTVAQGVAISAIEGPGDWFHAAEYLGPRPGNAYSVLADKGFLERRSDPFVWGRGQYRLTSLGLAVRAHLLTTQEETNDDSISH